jgi:hypothetical protein
MSVRWCLVGVAGVLATTGQAQGKIMLPNSADGTYLPGSCCVRPLSVLWDGVTGASAYPDIWEAAHNDLNQDDISWVTYYWNNPIVPQSSTLDTFFTPDGTRLWHYNLKYLDSNGQWVLWKDVIPEDPIHTGVFVDSLIGMPSTTGLKVNFISAKSAVDNETPEYIVLNEWTIQGASAVPEPSTLILWSGLGAMGLVAAWRRRKRGG